MTRFLIVLLAPDSPLVGGPDFRWQELWVALISYDDRSSVAANAGLIVLGWVSGLSILAAARERVAYSVLAALRVVVVFLAGMSTAGWLFLFLCVWSLATWMNNPTYNLDMLSVYGVGTMLSFMLALGAWYMGHRLREVFRLPESWF